MNKKQIGEAMTVAMEADLTGVDDSVLSGLYLPDFVHPVFTTIKIGRAHV